MSNGKLKYISPATISQQTYIFSINMETPNNDENIAGNEIEMNLKFNAPTTIDDDIDSEERKLESSIMGVLSRSDTKRLDTDNYDIQHVLERFKIAITFLLHPKSPLFSSDNNIEDEKQYENTNEIDNDTILQFQNNCRIFNNNTNYNQVGNQAHWRDRLRDLYSLYDEDYKDKEHRILNNMWSKWKENAKPANNDAPIRIVNYLMNTEERKYMQDNCDHFMDLYGDDDNNKLETNVDELTEVKDTKDMNEWLNANQLLKSKFEFNNSDENNKRALLVPMSEWNCNDLISYVKEVDE
eukprot:230926_1